MLRDIGLTRFDVAAALVEPALADGTLVLAERAREGRRNQRLLVREAQAWADPSLVQARRLNSLIIDECGRRPSFHE